MGISDETWDRLVDLAEYAVQQLASVSPRHGDLAMEIKSDIDNEKRIADVELNLDLLRKNRVDQRLQRAEQANELNKVMVQIEVGLEPTIHPLLKNRRRYMPVSKITPDDYQVVVDGDRIILRSYWEPREQVTEYYMDKAAANHLAVALADAVANG